MLSGGVNDLLVGWVVYKRAFSTSITSPGYSFINGIRYKIVAFLS